MESLVIDYAMHYAFNALTAINSKNLLLCELKSIAE